MSYYTEHHQSAQDVYNTLAERDKAFRQALLNDGATLGYTEALHNAWKQAEATASSELRTNRLLTLLAHLEEAGCHTASALVELHPSQAIVGKRLYADSLLTGEAD